MILETEKTLTSMTFSQAFDYLRRYADQRQDEDASLPLMMQAEEVILDHRPRDTEEAAIIIGMLIDNLAAGARSDGRDIAALGALQTWIAQDGPRHAAV